MLKTLRVVICFLLAVFLRTESSRSQNQTTSPAIPEKLYSAMRWRSIGPFRGGRVLAVSGVRGQPNTFYFGAVAGGIWKTTDAGRVWTPIFDDQPTASIGALAVSQSDPNVIYVGTGEADMRSDISFGAGVYKSTDAGKTWSYLGLADTRQIGRVLIDPKHPDIVLVAALGHGFGPNEERGVFRSTDGGKTWKKVLYKDENTGAIDLALDPDNPQTVYATLWNARRPAWSTYAPITGPGGGIYKSIDGGVSWRELTGHGLPTGKLGRIGIDVAAGTQGKRVVALIDAERAGLYVSNDAGESWALVSSEPRITSRAWYFEEVRVDPKNPEVVYVSNVSLYRSRDGGKTFEAFRGAPGGDDYHSLWIDPENPQRMISGVDQGTIITVNGGKTWSSWYNQPTAQFYHVAVDNQFPYFVYGAQQDSGTAAVASRSDYGQITYRDWYPIGAGESGYILPDPVDPEIVYGGSTGGETYRFNKRTGQVQDISPTPASVGTTVRQRHPWTTPIAFARQPPQALYQASQFLFKTTDGGNHWTTISPDLTLHGGEKEENAKGVIYTIAPSPVTAGTIWVGTDNGLIQLTRDEGKTWTNVSPKGLPPWSMISIIEAGVFAASTAYAAIDRHQMDDIRPYIYRTHDFGKTWTMIADGIPETAYVHVVREDPIRKGLLFAGTETGIYVSFDDGDHWQSLRLNLPVSPIRDLVIKDNDLVAATHGRSFWILDDILPLRELNSQIADADVHLFTPATVFRRRKNESRDTPLPLETPAGQNPPAGAIIDYSLKTSPAGEITLEILDSGGRLVRKFSSNDQPRKIDDTQPFPTYWLRPPAPLAKQAGMNRFVWDLRYSRPLALRYGYSIAAAYGEDAIMIPEGPLVLPGMYQAKLIVNGSSYTAPFEVKMDPRVRVSAKALEQQFALEMKVIEQMAQSYAAAQEVRDLRSQLKELQARIANVPKAREIAGATKALDEKAAVLLGGPPQYPPSPEPTLSALHGELASLLFSIDGSDTAPAAQFAAAFDHFRQLLEKLFAGWIALKDTDLPAFNGLLRQHQIQAIVVPRKEPEQ